MTASPNDKDGGAAFPSSNDVTLPDGSGTHGHSGMSLRDYFAAKAPIIPDSFIKDDPWTGNGHLQCLDEAGKQAYWAYRYADAMLSARLQTQEERK